MNDLPNALEGNMAGGSAFEERMRQLRGRFVERSRTDAEEVRAIRGHLKAGEPVSPEMLTHLFRTVHALAGAAGLFGFETVSEAALRVERILRAGETTTAEIAPSLAELGTRLDEVVQAR
jgi:chemotaxis protein histidine kinase CheA